MNNYRENASGVLEYQDMLGTWVPLRNSNNKIYRSVDQNIVGESAVGFNLMNVGNMMNNVCAQLGLPSAPIISVVMGMYTEIQKGVSNQLNMPIPQAQELLLKTVKSPLFWDAKEKELIGFAVDTISDYNKAPFPSKATGTEAVNPAIDMTTLLAAISSTIKSEVNSAIEAKFNEPLSTTTSVASSSDKIIK